MQHVVAIRTGFRYDTQWNVCVFEFQKETPCFVFAVGHWRSATRYDKSQYKFKFFDTKDGANEFVTAFKQRNGITSANKMFDDWQTRKKESDQSVKNEVEMW